MSYKLAIQRIIERYEFRIARHKNSEIKMCNFSFIFYSVVEVGFHKSSQGLGTWLKSNMQTSAYSLSCGNKLLFKLKEALEIMVCG